MADLKFQIDAGAQLRRRLNLKGQASLSIVITQVAGKREPGKPRPPDQFLLKMILIQPRPGFRPRKTDLHTRRCKTEELMWMTLRDLAQDRLLTLGQIVEDV